MPNENFRVPFEKSLLQLRFIGDGLEDRSVPIHELGNTLIAVQRIVNKTYLFYENRLDRAARPSGVERKEVALQLASKKASDGYGLIPIVTNPAFIGVLDEVVKVAVEALAAYAFGRLFSKRKQSINPALLVAIYPEVRSLTERIGGSGKVSALEIAQGNATHAEKIIIESQTKSYVREVEHGTLIGPKMKLSAYVEKLDLKTLSVAARVKKRRVKVRLGRTEFGRLKEKVWKDKPVTFIGHPVYKLGIDTDKFSDFTAEKFLIQRNTESDF